MEVPTFTYTAQYQLAFDKPKFEQAIVHCLRDIRRMFDVKYLPKSFTLNLHGDVSRNGSVELAGITTLTPRGERFHIDLRTRLPKESPPVTLAQFAPIVVHELFHLVVPVVPSSLLWTEGVTDFVTHWFLGHLDDLPRKQQYVERLRTKHPSYYRFKRPYVEGANLMLQLHRADERRTLSALKAIVHDANRSKATVFAPRTSADIVKYDSRFDVFFRHRQHGHRTWNTPTPTG